MCELETRRLAAVTALVLAAFAGLSLLTLPLTGPLGDVLGSGLWRLLGVGALQHGALGQGAMHELLGEVAEEHQHGGRLDLSLVDQHVGADAVGDHDSLEPPRVGLALAAQQALARALGRSRLGIAGGK